MFQYDLLHVTPPQSSPVVLHNTILVDSTNFVEVNKHSLQHKRFNNIFAMGDCGNTPTSKTAASVGKNFVYFNIHFSSFHTSVTGLNNGAVEGECLADNQKIIITLIKFYIW